MKNFDALYVVIRTYNNEWEVPCGVFETLQAAEDHADAWHQEIKDKDPELYDRFKFKVHSTVYYKL